LIATYYYDPFGRRLWKEVGGVRTYFFYADEGLIGEYDSTDNEIKTYGYRPDSAWTTNPLFMKDGSEHFFYHNDHLGIPQKMTAVNGAVVWAAKYTSFLNAEVDSSSTSENNLRAPGQYYDGETGLYYNLNRFYDPQLGRYLRADPIRLRSGINLFTYAKNNPLAYFDPFGLKEESAGGCGPGPIGDWFVPDKPAGYDFGSCCNDHDDCYKGKMGCDKEQPDCDDAFKKCMDDKCS
jgi:RHS repeat-associated protein